MNVGDVADAVSAVVRKHHDLFVAEVSKLLIPGIPADPIATAMLMASVMRNAEPGMVNDMRRWTLKEWAPVINRVIESRGVDPEPAPTPQGARQPTTIPIHIQKPQPSAMPPAGGAGGGAPPPTPPGGSVPPSGGPPAWMTDSEKFSWQQAKSRGGEFIRGLGNYIDQKTGQMVYEEWDKDRILRDVDPTKRQEVMDIIRQEVADAREQGVHAGQLAKRLAKATGQWGRNWERIARTELQGVYNEGVLFEHVRWDGENALIARVPEADACDECRRLFTENGKPKIFTAKELANNNTNVGIPRRDWKATIWPLHPNCRCDTQAVPQGMEFDDNWVLTV